MQLWFIKFIYIIFYILSSILLINFKLRTTPAQPLIQNPWGWMHFGIKNFSDVSEYKACTRWYLTPYSNRGWHPVMKCIHISAAKHIVIHITWEILRIKIASHQLRWGFQIREFVLSFQKAFNFRVLKNFGIKRFLIRRKLKFREVKWLVWLKFEHWFGCPQILWY